MPVIRQHPRMTTGIAYFFVLTTFLSVVYRDDFFCKQDGRSSLEVPAVMVCLVVAVDLLGSLCSYVVSRFVFGLNYPGFVGIFTATAIVAIILVPLPYLLFSRFGWEGTRFGISCLVTEGYGMIFPIFTGPCIVLMTFVREWTLSSLIRRKATVS
jgi:ABC-type glycerol-3-phosphate transport system permease component